MPLTPKGQTIMTAMVEEYTKKLGSVAGRKKAKNVFYASRNAGKIKGVD